MIKINKFKNEINLRRGASDSGLLTTMHIASKSPFWSDFCLSYFLALGLYAKANLLNNKDKKCQKCIKLSPGQFPGKAKVRAEWVIRHKSLKIENTKVKNHCSHIWILTIWNVKQMQKWYASQLAKPWQN